MIKLPLGENWNQLNTSDKFGSIAYSKNINLDKKGFVSLSPRMINVFDDSGSVSNESSTNFDFPTAFGRYSLGTMRLATTDEPFNLQIDNTTKTIAEDSSSNNPNLNFQSHGCWFQNKWHESTDTAVYSNSAGTWTANVISSLTSGVRHYLAAFKNKTSLAVTNGNTVKLYDTSYSNTQTLTLPSDYEIIGIAYNNYTLGIVTRLGTDSAGQNSNAYFFSWDGSSSDAGTGTDMGAYTSVGIYPYKSSFVIITSSGQLLYWNGGGFDPLASFPFYVEGQDWGDLTNFLQYGDNIIVDGDVIYMNLAFEMARYGTKQEQVVYKNLSGIWCYDPENGLYHRYSLSNSRGYAHAVTSANVNTTTNIITTAFTIPETGSPMFMVSGLGGIEIGEVYYVIKLSSTTFKIAQDRERAMAGDALDITSASSNNYFWLFEEKDFGAGYINIPGAIGLWGVNSMATKDIIAGGRTLNDSLTAQITLCTAVPQLENRGYFVTPKLFLNSITEKIQNVIIKHSPLDKNDAIILKVKNKEYLGVPVSSPNSASTSYITWTGKREGYTTSDLSKIKELFDADIEIEVEFTAGSGAGQMVKLKNILESSGTYTLEMEEDVFGASSGKLSYFVMDTWKVCGSVDQDTEKEGVFDCPVAAEGKSPQFKIELRGYQTTIEDILINNATHTK